MKKISGYLIGVVLIIATLAISGWMLDIEFLKRPFEETKYMNPVTAVSMVAACISFYLQCKINPTKNRILAGKILAFGVLSISLSKLIALTGINVNVEYWLFKDKVIAEGGTVVNPGSLAIINSAVGFFITGLALLLTGLKGKWPGSIITYLGLFGFIVGTFVCVGFIYHINEFFGILPYMSVAPTTGVCFVFFSVAMMFEHNDAGFMKVISSRYSGGNISRWLVPIGIGVPVFLGYVGLSISWWIPFSAALGTALLSVSIIIIFLVALWFLARALNITDEARQKALMQLERQAQLFNVIPDAVIYGDKDFTITNLNPAGQQIFEVRDEEIGNLKIDALFEVDLGATNREAVRKELWGDKGFWRGESVLTTRTGKRINAMVLLKAVENEIGEKVGWLGVYTDISFLRLNEELQAANNYLEQLAFISAHDIKSPILTLQGLVDLMVAGDLTAENLRILGMQKNVILQMQATNKALNEILKLRQKLKVKDTGNSQPLPLREILNNITNIVDTDIKNSGATLELDLDEVSEIKLQPVYFQSLFYNLIANSIKYRDAARPLIIKFTGRKTSEDTIQFNVEDNGMGFDLLHNKKRMFGIFKRFHNHVEGTGVGLHIVKSIVDAFDGSIEVKSQPGKGTSFQINFKISSLF